MRDESEQRHRQHVPVPNNIPATGRHHRQRPRREPLEGKFAVHLDLGIQGLGILLGLSLVYGAFALVIFGRSSTYWVGPIAAVAAFIAGFFMSEVVVGTMTIDEIQPIIDGLAFDEAMLGGLGAALLASVATWATLRSTRVQRALAR